MTAAPTTVYTEATTSGTAQTVPNPPTFTLSGAAPTIGSFVGSQSLTVSTTANAPSSGTILVTTQGTLHVALIRYTSIDATHFLNCTWDDTVGSALAGDTVLSSGGAIVIRVADPGDVILISQSGTSSGAGTASAPTGIGTITDVDHADTTAGGRIAVWYRILTASDFDSAGSLQLKTITMSRTLFSNHRYTFQVARHANGWRDSDIINQHTVHSTNDATTQTLTDTSRPAIGISVVASSANLTSTNKCSWDAGTSRAFNDSGSGVAYQGGHSNHYGFNNAATARGLADYNEWADTDTVTSWKWDVNFNNTTHRAVTAVLIVAPTPVFGTQAVEHDSPHFGLLGTTVIGTQVVEHDSGYTGLIAGGPVVGAQKVENDTPHAGILYQGTAIVGTQRVEHDRAVAGGFFVQNYTDHIPGPTAAHYRLTTLVLRGKKSNTFDAGQVSFSLLQGATTIAGPTAWTSLTDSFADYSLDVSSAVVTDPTNLYIAYSFRRELDASLEPAISWIALNWEAFAVEHDVPHTGIVSTPIFIAGTQKVEHDTPHVGIVTFPTVVLGTQAVEQDSHYAGHILGGYVFVTGSLKVEQDHASGGQIVQGTVVVTGSRVVEEDGAIVGVLINNVPVTIDGSATVEHDRAKHGGGGTSFSDLVNPQHIVSRLMRRVRLKKAEE